MTKIGNENISLVLRLWLSIILLLLSINIFKKISSRKKNGIRTVK